MSCGSNSLLRLLPHLYRNDLNNSSSILVCDVASYGCQALKDGASKNELLGEYTGELITQTEVGSG